MKLTTRAFPRLSRILFGLQGSAPLVCSRDCGLLSEASRPRIWRREITSIKTKDHFRRVPIETPIEEELLPGYKAENYYPITTGQILNSRYRIVCKLGCGVGSTVWLAKDIEWDGPDFLCSIDHLFIQFADVEYRTSQYRAVKVCTRTKDGSMPTQASQEIAVAEYLKTAPVQEHPGKRSIRTALASFALDGPHGSHTCLIYKPEGMTFTELRDYLPENRLPKRMLQTSIQVLLITLDYLHKNSVVHTG